MKTKVIFSLYIVLVFITACQTSTPPPLLTAATNTDFVLAPEQTAFIPDIGLKIKFVAISSDERCHSKMECAISGPVTLTISLQKDSGNIAEFVLQTFTNNNGLAPEMQFEGIQDRVEYESHLVQIKSVQPYPADLADRNNLLGYRVTFIVTEIK